MTYSLEPADAYNLPELREKLNALAADGKHRVVKLDEAPLDYPGCDDKNNRFAWYSMEEADGKKWRRTGVFHLPKGVEL